MRTDRRESIALLISSFRAGGGERVMIDVANQLARTGHGVDLLVLKPVGQYESQVDTRVRVVSLDARRIILSLPKLMKYMTHERPSTLLALDEYTHLLALIAKRVTGVPVRVVLRVGNMYSELFARYEGVSAYVLPFLIRRLYKHADAMIAVSKGVKDEVVRITGIDEARVAVIYNPKPLDEIRTKAQEDIDHPWFTDRSGPVIVSVGRLRVQKNFPVLIQAFAKLPPDAPARLMIVGAGREEGRLRTLIEKLGLTEKVALVGYVDNPYRFMAHAIVVVSASLWEGMPNGILEAMASGAAIVASDCDSGPREILAPDSDYRTRLTTGVEYAAHGVLVAVNDEEALAQALERMLTDTDLRTAYRKQSMARIQDFNQDTLLPEYERVLKAIVSV